MTKKIMLTNEKGGVGKSLTTDMVCYELAKLDKKVLLVDLDPQANSTQILGRTHKLATGKTLHIKETLMSAVANGKLAPAITNIVPNLDILPNYKDFYHYPWYAITQSLKVTHKPKKLHDLTLSLFDYLFTPIIKSNKYDYIFYDCPPTISTYVESAMMDVDYIAVILQTEDPSFDGAKEFLDYAGKFEDKYDSAHFNFLGMIAVLKKRSPIDNDVLARAKSYFGKGSLIGVIKWFRRVERYSSQGISVDVDYHDKKIMSIYKKLTESLLNRIENGGM